MTSSTSVAIPIFYVIIFNSGWKILALDLYDEPYGVKLILNLTVIAEVFFGDKCKQPETMLIYLKKIPKC